MTPLLDLQNLSVTFPEHGKRGPCHAVRDVSFSLYPGETVALVGESGSGKSATARAIARLLPRAHVEGRALFEGVDLLSIPEQEMNRTRSRRLGMIFQDPMTSLNPSMQIGKQIVEARLYHDSSFSRKSASSYAIELLRQVGMPDPEERIHYYPHMLSGGQRQRVMIALALACRPKLLIADEPTTSLDVTIQAQILHTLKRVQQETGVAILLITHDLGVVAEVCDRVLVMYDGQIVESASVDSLFATPQHPYTNHLLQSLPRLDEESELLPSTKSSTALLEVRNLTQRYGRVTALDNLSLTIHEGEALGVVGESGSGKSTLARTLLMLQPCTEGEVLFEGSSLKNASPSKLFAFRRAVQPIFQDPYSSLNPRRTVQEIVEEPLLIHRVYGCSEERYQRVHALLQDVGLAPDLLRRFPHELSGGQRQRVSIARALALSPRLLICDEPISSLDSSIRKQVVDLLRTLCREKGLSLLFIAHDLAMVRYLCTRVAVIYAGQIVELAESETLYKSPEHPYTQALLSATPRSHFTVASAAQRNP